MELNPASRPGSLETPSRCTGAKHMSVAEPTAPGWSSAAPGPGCWEEHWDGRGPAGEDLQGRVRPGAGSGSRRRASCGMNSPISSWSFRCSLQAFPRPPKSSAGNSCRRTRFRRGQCRALCKRCTSWQLAPSPYLETKSSGSSCMKLWPQGSRRNHPGSTGRLRVSVAKLGRIVRIVACRASAAIGQGKALATHAVEIKGCIPSAVPVSVR